jgi:sugar lactone lactonase YvrE
MLRMSFAALAAAVALTLPVSAGTPKNALGAVAVSPNGQFVVAAGDNLTLYLLDAATLTVQARHWIGVNPESMAFSADGTTLLVVDIDGTLTFLDTTTFQPRNAVEGMQATAVLAPADKVVAITKPKRDGDAYRTELVVLALADGRELLRGVAPVEGTAVGGTADASAFAILSRAADSTTETKTQAPQDKKGFDRDIFEQQNDGKASAAVVFNAAGQIVATHPLWWSTYNTPQVAIADGAIYAIDYSNENLRVDLATGAAGMFQVTQNYNYGAAFAADHRVVVTGGLGDGSVGPLAGPHVAFEIDRVGNWPEYLEGFAVGPDGTFYAGTTSYRLIKVGPDGTVQAAAPVF